MIPHNTRYTQVPNILFDLMPHISMAQFSVLMIVARQTYGWQKHEDTISLSQFADKTGLSIYGTRQAIAALSTHGFLLRRRVGKQHHCYTIDLNKIAQFIGKVDSAATKLDDELCNSVAQSNSELYNSVAQSSEKLCNSETQLDDELCNSVAPQKKEFKEKEIKKDVFPFSSNSSVSAPDEDIAKVLGMWENVTAENATISDKKALRLLVAQYGTAPVSSAIEVAYTAGKVSLGYVTGVLKNTATAHKSNHGGGATNGDKPKVPTFKRWLLENYTTDMLSVVISMSGKTESALQREYELAKLSVEGCRVVPGVGLADAMAAV